MIIIEFVHIKHLDKYLQTGKQDINMQPDIL
jgi:hypothetical protein